MDDLYGGAMRRRMYGPAMPPPMSMTPDTGPMVQNPTAPELAHVQANPAVDMDTMMRNLRANAGNVPGQGPLSADHPYADAISRALVGFNYGAGSVPKEAAYNPVLGGIVGGLSGMGRQEMDAIARRQAAQQPYMDLQKTLANESAKGMVSDRYGQAKEQRDFDRQWALTKERERGQAALLHGLQMHPGDAMAIQKQAEQEAMTQGAFTGILPGTPEFIDAVNANIARISQQSRALGAKQVVVPPQAPAKPKPAAGAPAWQQYDK